MLHKNSLSSSYVLCDLASQSFVKSVEQRDFEKTWKIWPPCSDLSSFWNFQQKPRKSRKFIRICMVHLFVLAPWSNSINFPQFRDFPQLSNFFTTKNFRKKTQKSHSSSTRPRILRRTGNPKKKKKPISDHPRKFNPREFIHLLSSRWPNKSI